MNISTIQGTKDKQYLSTAEERSLDDDEEILIDANLMSRVTNIFRLAQLNKSRQ